MHFESVWNLFPVRISLNALKNFKTFEIGLRISPNESECSPNVTNALRISPNALQIFIRTAFGSSITGVLTFHATVVTLTQ